MEFSQLHKCLPDKDALEATYDDWVSTLTGKPYWSPGSARNHRIRWREGYEARDELTAFDSSGLYLWGADETPLYLGITGSTFRKRFNRYIWGRRSQCKLAERYESELVADGIKGFPSEVRDWYAKNFGTSTVRLRGAVAFARHGIDRIWFSLVPHDNAHDIKELEASLIPVAAAWGQRQGHPPLLNVQHM